MLGSTHVRVALSLVAGVIVFVNIVVVGAVETARAMSRQVREDLGRADWFCRCREATRRRNAYFIRACARCGCERPFRNEHATPQNAGMLDDLYNVADWN